MNTHPRYTTREGIHYGQNKLKQTNYIKNPSADTRKEWHQEGAAMFGKRSGAFDDREAQQQSGINPFSEQKIRQAFISKVYSIVMLQLFLTFATMAFVTFHEPSQRWLLANIWISFVAMGVAFVVVIALSCFEAARRTTPHNYILLGLFTLCEAFLFGVLGVVYPSGEIFMAMGITALVVLVLTIFAMQTKIDFTGCGAFFLILLVILLVLGIVAIFFPSRTMILVKASFGVLVFSLYLIYDTQLIMGGRNYAIGPEDYVFAALTIYIDIINLFVSILQILGVLGDD